MLCIVLIQLHTSVARCPQAASLHTGVKLKVLTVVWLRVSSQWTGCGLVCGLRQDGEVGGRSVQGLMGF